MTTTVHTDIRETDSLNTRDTGRTDSIFFSSLTALEATKGRGGIPSACQNALSSLEPATPCGGCTSMTNCDVTPMGFFYLKGSSHEMQKAALCVGLRALRTPSVNEHGNA